MRYIRWNQEVVDATLEDFNDFKGYQKTVWGFVAENLVKSYYGEPLSSNTGTPDDGYDMVLHGMEIDIKSDICDDRYFSNPYSLFTVSGKKKLHSEYYLFTKIDPDKHSIALIGYLWAAEVALKGTYYKKGEYIPAFKKKAHESCYLVSQNDLHRIN